MNAQQQRELLATAFVDGEDSIQQLSDVMGVLVRAERTRGDATVAVMGAFAADYMKRDLNQLGALRTMLVAQNVEKEANENQAG